MTKEEILSYVVTALSDINFMLLMILIIMVAACFFGRYVNISRKMIIATIGILVLQIVVLFASDFILLKANPELYNAIDNLDISNGVSMLDDEYRTYYAVIFLIQMIINLAVFVYAFVFYLVCYKEKKFLRALESTLILFLLSQYESMIIQYFLIYLKGGDPEYYNKLFSTVVSPHRIFRIL